MKDISSIADTYNRINPSFVISSRFFLSAGLLKKRDYSIWDL